MFKELRHTGTIYVLAIRVSALEAIKASALEVAGGYTATPGEGGWAAEQGRNIQSIAVVEVAFDALEPMMAWVENSVETLKEYGEVAVLAKMQSGDVVTAGLHE